MRFARLLLVGLGLALVVCFYVSRRTEARSSACECNRNAPDVIGDRFMPNSTLRVMFLRGDFSTAEIGAFQEAIRLWQAVLPKTGTGIDLQMGGEITGKDCTGCIIVKRKADLGGTFAALSLLSTQGQFYRKAVINIKSDVHKTVMLRMLLTHELGHAFGLDDCEECAGNTTVMNSVNKYAFGAFSFLAPRNKMAAAPTECDIARVSVGYAGATRMLALTASSAPVVRAQDQIQSRSVSTSAPLTKPTATTTAEASARHHASRVASASQRPVKIEQLMLMDALARRE